MTCCLHMLSDRKMLDNHLGDPFVLRKSEDEFLSELVDMNKERRT